MSLYSFNGGYPKLLPNRIRLPNGLTRTDPSTFTTQEITKAGYVLVPDKPEPTSSQVVEWNTTTVEWVVREKTAEELQEDYDRRVEEAIEKTKHVVRLKLAAIHNPVTNSPMSVETTKEAIERDLEHGSANQTMILNQPAGGPVTEDLKGAILVSQSKGIAILVASKRVYAEIKLDPEYDYENSPYWPVF